LPSFLGALLKKTNLFILMLYISRLLTNLKNS